jgi:acetolactate synthase small subunit
MPNSYRATRLLGPKGVERATFVIVAENRSDILATVVHLFQDLNVEIEALYMVRRRKSETMRIHVTVEASQEACRSMEANFDKDISVRSVKTERVAKDVLGEAFDKKLRGRD